MRVRYTEKTNGMLGTPPKFHSVIKPTGVTPKTVTPITRKPVKMSYVIKPTAPTVSPGSAFSPTFQRPVLHRVIKAPLPPKEVYKEVARAEARRAAVPGVQPCVELEKKPQPKVARARLPWGLIALVALPVVALPLIIIAIKRKK